MVSRRFVTGVWIGARLFGCVAPHTDMFPRIRGNTKKINDYPARCFRHVQLESTNIAYVGVPLSRKFSFKSQICLEHQPFVGGMEIRNK